MAKEIAYDFPEAPSQPKTQVTETKTQEKDNKQLTKGFLANSALGIAYSAIDKTAKEQKLSKEEVVKRKENADKIVHSVFTAAEIGLLFIPEAKAFSTFTKIGLGIAKAAAGSDVGGTIGKSLDKAFKTENPYFEDLLTLAGGLVGGSSSKALGEAANSIAGRIVFGTMGATHAGVTATRLILDDDPNYTKYEKAKDVLYAIGDIGAIANGVVGAQRGVDKLLAATKYGRNWKPNYNSISEAEAQAVLKTWKGTKAHNSGDKTLLDVFYDTMVKPFIEATNKSAESFNSHIERGSIRYKGLTQKQDLIELPKTEQEKFDLCVKFAKKIGVNEGGDFKDPMGTDYQFNVFGSQKLGSKAKEIIKNEGKPTLTPFEKDHSISKSLKQFRAMASKDTSRKDIAIELGSVENWQPIDFRLNKIKGEGTMNMAGNAMRRFVNATDNSSLPTAFSMARFRAPAAAVVSNWDDGSSEVLQKLINDYTNK